MKGLKRYLVIAAVFILVAVSASGAAYAISMFIKNISGIGQVNYTAAVGVDNIQVKSMTKVTVTLVSTPQTVAGKVYQADIYLDDVKQNLTQTVSWTAGQIPGGKKKLDFTTTSLATVTQIDAEVTE